MGRAVECTLLDRLFAEARDGHSRVLMIRGAPGVGKTACLHHVTSQARGGVLLTARGMESEATIAFSGLSELLGPLVSRIKELEPVQATALSSALALHRPAGGDRFIVQVATLNLLALAAERRPAVAVVDDAQWLDASSRDCIISVAQRLKDEGILFLLAAREDIAETWELGSLLQMRLDELSRTAAELLVRASAGNRDMAPDVVTTLLRTTRGNPLAIIESVASMTDGQLAGRESLEDPLPVGPQLNSIFRRRIAALPADTRAALVVVAANDQDDSLPIRNTLRLLDIDPAVLAPAEAGRLIEMSVRHIRFQHPIIRAVSYHGAQPAARRHAHQALSQALDDLGQHDRGAWHAALACIAPSEEVALGLAKAGASAAQRGAPDVASRCFERAAELTLDNETRSARMHSAGASAFWAGNAERARVLLRQAGQSTRDTKRHASIYHMLGYVETWRGPAPVAQNLLVEEANRVHDEDPQMAAQILIDAIMPSIMIGDINGARDIAGRATHLAQIAEDGRLSQIARAGEHVVAALTSNAGQAHRGIRTALADVDPAQIPSHLRAMLGQVAVWAEEYASAIALLERLVDDALGVAHWADLAFPLAILADAHYRAGSWDESLAYATQAVETGVQTGQESALSFSLIQLAKIEAVRGLDTDCRTHVARAVALAEPRGGLAIQFFAWAVLGLLELTLGKPEEACRTMDFLGAAEDAIGLRQPGVVTWLPDAVESAVRAGDRAAAEQLTARLADQSAATGNPWATATLARCRGMLSDDDRMVEHFESALQLQTHRSFERARTQLCYAERLRRARRRMEASRLLTLALTTFDALRARPWSERARSELAACGGRTLSQPTDLTPALTTREMQVALAVARGATNREVGTAMFLSEKTIETHLSSVYRKLGVRRRSQLTVLFAQRNGPGRA